MFVALSVWRRGACNLNAVNASSSIRSLFLNGPAGRLEALLNAGAESKKGKSFMVQLLGVPLWLALMGLLAWIVQQIYPSSGVHFGGFQGGSAKDVGHALFTTYLLPFEVTSILILIAILGAVVLARKEMD